MHDVLRPAGDQVLDTGVWRDPAVVGGDGTGLFNMASLGLRALSGIAVGLLGSLIGIHWSLALSSLATMVVAGGLLAIR